jgi:hypothetical protein
VALAFDAVGPSSSGQAGTGTSTSWSHTCTGSSGLLLAAVAVDISSGSDAGLTCTATYNGVSMTSVQRWESGGAGQVVGFVQVFKLIAPATGANTVAVSVSGGTPDKLAAGSLSFSGADQTTGTGTPAHSDSGGAGTTSGSVSVTGTASGSIAAAFVTCGSGSLTFTSGTSRFAVQQIGGGAAGTCGGATAVSAGGTVSVTWTQGSDFYGAIAVEVLAASGGGTANAGVAAVSAAAPQPGIAGSVTSQGVPVSAHSATGAVTGTWPTGSSQVAGRVLVAAVTAGASTSAAAISTPSGWAKQVEEGNSATANTRAAIYTKVASGGDAAPSFTSTESGTAGGMDCMLFELIGADTTTVVDTSGVFGSGSSSATLGNATFTCTTSGSPHAGGYAIAVFSQERTAANLTFTDSGTGWAKLLNGNGASARNQAAILVQGSPSTAGTLNDHGQFSTDTTAFGAAIVAVFLLGGPSTSASAGAATAACLAVQPGGTGRPAAATAAAAAPQISFKPYIAGLGGTGAGYFADQHGSARMVLGDAAWGLCGNAGRWNSGNWQADYDGYLGNRAAQGFTAIYTKPMGTTQNLGINDDGRTFDSLFPFQGGTPATGVSLAAPSSGLTSAYWARIDYMLSSALAKGITVFLNAIGYDSDFESSGPLAGKSSTEFGAYGTALGTRYASQPNLVWMVADDYFGAADASIAAFLTGLRGAGDTHPIAIENMPESTSRNTLDTSPSVAAWGTAHAQFNFVYTYNVTYRGVEQAYLETSPVPVIWGDGYFYQGGNSGSYQGGTGAFAYDHAVRQDAWHAVSSGARGWINGSEGIWQYQSTALADSNTEWWYVHGAGVIRTVMESLPGWHLLVPDTSSALVTAGRGTHAGAFASGGGGGQYEVKFTDAYVTASRTPDSGSGSSLAVIYMSHATTITIDQTKIASGYTATWVDPLTGAASSATPGSTFNSTAKGSNSAGEADWALVLQAPTTVSATAGVAAATAAAAPPSLTATATAGAATGSVAAPVPVATVAAKPTAAAALGATVSASSSISASAGVTTASATAPQPAMAFTASPGVATAQAAAPPFVPAVAALPGVATAAGVPPQPSVSASGSVSASAGVASAGAVATQPGTSTTVSPPAAASAGTAGLPASAASIQAGVAVAPGAAVQPVPAATVPAAPAAGAATPAGATVSTVTQAQAHAGVAMVAAAPAQPSAAATAQAGVAAASAGVPLATAQAASLAQAAAAAATAMLPSLTLGTFAHAGAAAALAQAAGGQVPAQVVTGTVRAAQMALPQVEAGQMALARAQQGQAPLAHAQGGQWP